VFSVPPTPVDPALVAVQEAAMAELGLPPFALPSGAGHDAMLIGAHAPMAMFFVRSRDGVSHNPREYSSLNDCAQAAHALSRTLTSLVNDPASPDEKQRRLHNV